ncbi:SDR family oxidoreductase [Bacillus sp. CMF21]|uniref:elongation factor P 5-aminopentanone reductase n=1 Tax=Metabacillus dongyingensis TaxID=2874282 RepID=UPI001CBC4D72|nr:SDR family oxidoreductase [Metabacillus dongyingensis]UAL54322.1 SDR family oxidoreductase [Metabacillus dongyingensis]UOK59581.1 SDR family oxidoreductase [Bacillus sp. OVS6]USK30642.1 SDR family oxidoreductase [Bacillus sp. CMF21]
MKKTALITGASGGIGKAIAKKLAGEGYKLYLHYHKNEESILTLIKELQADCTMVKADLSNADGPGQLVKQLADPIDLLVLNSGRSFFGLMTDMENEEIQQMVQLQITSPYMISKELIPSMVSRKCGNIVVISSIWGEIGASCEVLYSMVKGGQNTFVKALAKELAPSGIRVNAIAPGAVATDMLQSFSEEDLADLEEEIPLGRIGKPEEIADAVLFLSSNHASYITGQVLSVNGGWHT